MLLFLTGLPLWASGLLVVALPSIAAMVGTILVRRWLGHDYLVNNNEIAGFKFATVGVIYAVLLAFAVIVVWEKFSDAEIAVVDEAGAAATVYRLVAGPEPEKVAARAALGDLSQARDRGDWPRMAMGRESREATEALSQLYAAVLRIPVEGPKQQEISAEVLKELDKITEARRTRLHLATGIVPGVIWLVLFSGAALTVELYALLRLQESIGSGRDDRHPVRPRVHGPAGDRLDRPSRSPARPVSEASRCRR